LADPKTPQQRVASGEFTYAPDSRVKPMVTALPFDTLHFVLRALFTQCFVSGHSDPRTRPSAREWQKALDKAAQELRSCTANEKHIYGAHLGNACPWCAKVARGLNDPFPRRVPIRVQPIAKPPASRAFTPPAQPVKKGFPWLKVITFVMFIIAVIHLLRGC
jgi:DNA-binding helix-hairpin-helix protein with protein kinase domain